MRALTFAAGEGSRAPSTTSGADLDYVIPRCPESAAPCRFEKRCGPKSALEKRGPGPCPQVEGLSRGARKRRRRKQRLIQQRLEESWGAAREKPGSPGSGDGFKKAPRKEEHPHPPPPLPPQGTPSAAAALAGLFGYLSLIQRGLPEKESGIRFSLPVDYSRYSPRLDSSSRRV